MSTPAAGRTIERELIFAADLATVYETIATRVGWQRWLIEEGTIEEQSDGALQLTWDIGASVQVTILDERPGESITMEWFAPSEPGRTTVTFQVAQTPDGTRFRLAEAGFGEGEAWDRCYAATNEVWDFALGRLQARLD